MVTLDYEANLQHYSGLAADTKPLGHYPDIPVPNGSYYHELDTGKVYRFAQNGNTGTWYEQPGAGGGGGGETDMMIVDFTAEMVDGNIKVTPSATFAEIKAASEKGIMIFSRFGEAEYMVYSTFISVDEGLITFYSTSISDSTLTQGILSIDENDNANLSLHRFTLTPAT